MSALAAALLQAHQAHRPLSAADWPLPDAAELAAAQHAVVEALDGQAASCWKSGGPARDPQRLGHSPLPRSQLRQARAGQTLDVSALWLPHGGAEAEIAFRIGREVTAELAAALDQAGALALCDAMALSLELTASRWSEGGAAPDALRQADLQSHAALLLGPWLPLQPQRDWARQACEIRIGEDEPVRRVGSHSLIDPAWLLPHWLRFACRDGRTVPAGTVVTTGSWTGNLPLHKGQRVVVISFAGLGELSAQA